MRRALAALTAAALALVTPPLGRDPAHAATAQLVVDCQPPSDTCWPIAFAFTPNQRDLFYLERYSGEIHRVRLRTGRDQVWGQVGPVDADGERGALGLALDPRWNTGKAKQRKKRRWVYVFYTHAEPLENRVVRLRKRLRGPGTIQDQLLTISIDTGSNHNAGVIHIGPDKKLYVVTGDQAETSRSQDLADPAGKVLRMKLNGGRPADNPIPGSLAYSFGHRNSFGFAFDPLTNRLWQSENGPDCDEMNLVFAGRNYGWGPGSSGTCPTSTAGPDPTPPEIEWDPVIVPTGVSFCVECGLGPDVEGDVLLGSFGEDDIRRLDLDAERDDVTGETVIYNHSSGVLAVERKKNGQVWFSSNDGIYRLTA